MKQELTVPISVLLLALVVGSGSAAESVHPDLKSGKKQLRVVALVPIQINLTKLGMKGAEPLRQESLDMELPLSLEIGAALAQFGYQMDRELLAPAREKGADLRYMLDDMQRRFDGELVPMARKSKDVRKGRFSIGDEVAKLPLRDSVDALLFVRVNGRILTSSKKAFGTFIAGPASDKVKLELALVDARVGTVLHFGKATIEDDGTSAAESVAAALARAFSSLPRAKAVATASRSEAIAAKTLVGDLDAHGTMAAGPSESSQAEYSEVSLRRVQVSRAVWKNLVTNAVRPQYPGIAAASGAYGDVLVNITVDGNGRVMDARMVSGPVQFVYAATAAAKQWRFRPLVADGQVLEFDTQITFSFVPGQ